jgi:hypothetical protein
MLSYVDPQARTTLKTEDEDFVPYANYAALPEITHDEAPY